MLRIACPSRRATDSSTIFPHFSRFSGQRDRVGDDQPLERRLLDPLDRRARQHAVHRAREHALGAGLHQRLRALLNRARRVDDVVGDDARAAADLTDHVHHFRRAIVAAPLVDDGQFGAEPLRVRARALGAAGIGRDDRQPRKILPRQVVDDHRRGKQVIDRDVEEPLNLRLVQIHRQHAIGAGRAQDVGHQLGRNRHARLVLAILPRVSVVRQHRRDARRRRPAERIDHDEQLDQMLIDRRARRLDDEDIGAADVLVDLERDFRVRKAAQPALPQRHAQKLADLASRAAGARCRKRPSDRRSRSVAWRITVAFIRTAKNLVGAEGFEPSNTGSKDPRLTAWPRPTITCVTWRLAHSTSPARQICLTRALPPSTSPVETLSLYDVPDARKHGTQPPRVLGARQRARARRPASPDAPGRAAVRRAASRRSNRPKTADPEPDIAANTAPGLDQRLLDAADGRVMAR